MHRNSGSITSAPAVVWLQTSSRRTNHIVFQDLKIEASKITNVFSVFTVPQELWTGDAIISSFDRNNHSEEAGEYLSECKDAVL